MKRNKDWKIIFYHNPYRLAVIVLRGRVTFLLWPDICVTSPQLFTLEVHLENIRYHDLNIFAFPVFRITLSRIMSTTRTGRD